MLALLAVRTPQLEDVLVVLRHQLLHHPFARAIWGAPDLRHLARLVIEPFDNADEGAMHAAAMLQSIAQEVGVESPEARTLCAASGIFGVSRALHRHRELAFFVAGRGVQTLSPREHAPWAKGLCDYLRVELSSAR